MIVTAAYIARAHAFIKARRGGIRIHVTEIVKSLRIAEFAFVRSYTRKDQLGSKPVSKMVRKVQTSLVSFILHLFPAFVKNLQPNYPVNGSKTGFGCSRT